MISRILSHHESSGPPDNNRGGDRVGTYHERSGPPDNNRGGDRVGGSGEVAADLVHPPQCVQETVTEEHHHRARPPTSYLKPS